MQVTAYPGGSNPLPFQGRQIGFKISAPLVKGDSPQCGEMSRSDRGDGRQLGGCGVAAGGIARFSFPNFMQQLFALRAKCKRIKKKPPYR